MPASHTVVVYTAHPSTQGGHHTGLLALEQFEKQFQPQRRHHRITFKYGM